MLNFKRISIVAFLASSLAVAAVCSNRQGPLFSPDVVQAGADTCPQVVKTALSYIDQRCASTGRNSTCYGHVNVQVEAQAGAPKFTFARPGDKVPLKNVRSLTLSSLSTDSSQWGMALLRIQANLADTAPGQNVTLLLFGNVEITDASKIAIHPTDLPAMAVTPAPSTPAVPSPSTRTTSPTPPPIVATTAAYKPMQAFYFSSGIGTPSCNEAPEDGILIQSPQGDQKIDLLVNEARIVIGSTVFLQAQASKELIVNTLEGSALVSSFGQSALANAGSRVRVPLDANLKASGSPRQPEPYNLAQIQPVPAQHLPQKVTAATPVAPLPAGFTESTWRVTNTAPTVSGGDATYTCFATQLFSSETIVLAIDTSHGSMRWGNITFSGSGGSFVYLVDIPVSDGTLTVTAHYRSEFHFTSPTHADGSFTGVMVQQPFCRSVSTYQLDLVGGPGFGSTLPSTPATF